jgi:RHS repeat-associated protein
MPNGSTYSYDAENHLLSTAGVNYTYDGDGTRVEKSNGTIYWHGAGGDALDESTLSGSLTNEYIFFGGARIARRDPSSNVFYNFSDHLGTARSIAEVPSGQTTATKCYDADLYPYGGERWYTDSCDSHYKFTGKERDPESGLDNFGARYNSSSMGRFMSPDPIFMTKHRLIDPQQWNLYTYVRNNPLKLTDPTGKDLWERGCGKESSTCHDNYVGTWDKNHHKFTPTTIQSDQNGNFNGHNVTMTTNGITVDGRYQGVFASGTSATVVNGTGNLSGFQATFNGNCGGTCEAIGTLSALPGHSFSQLLATLRGPNEKGDKLTSHEGDQYRGGNTEGPDIHISYLANRDSQSAHFDWRFPFGSVGGLAEHSGDAIDTVLDKYLFFQKDDPPYYEVGPWY